MSDTSGSSPRALCPNLQLKVSPPIPVSKDVDLNSSNNKDINMKVNCIHYNKDGTIDLNGSFKYELSQLRTFNKIIKNNGPAVNINNNNHAIEFLATLNSKHKKEVAAMKKKIAASVGSYGTAFDPPPSLTAQRSGYREVAGGDENHNAAGAYGTAFAPGSYGTAFDPPFSLRHGVRRRGNLQRS